MNSHLIPIINRLKPLKNKDSIFVWGSRGRKFESSHPDSPEANKIKASGIFYAVIVQARIVINGNKLSSTPIITPIIFPLLSMHESANLKVAFFHHPSSYYMPLQKFYYPTIC